MTKKEPEKWLKIEIVAPVELMDAVVNFLTETGAQGVFQETNGTLSQEECDEVQFRDAIKAYFLHDDASDQRIAAIQNYLISLKKIFPDLPAPALTTEIISDPGWGEEWKKYFKPLKVSKHIIVKPTWEQYAPSKGDIVIDIDPGMAFGTGQHPSTRMCIEALEDIMTQNTSVQNCKTLDVGCGTGILGIIAARLGALDVLCLDNDPKATNIAAENAAINLVSDRLHIVNQDALEIKEPRNLIMANLTSKLLLNLCPHLTQLLVPGGYIIISGIMEKDARDIEKSFSVPPLIQHRMLKEKEWVCYVLKKEAPAA
jgi:ribosomal protein L11 methyltransferase